MAKDSLSGANMFQAFAEAQNEDRRQERYERERYMRQRNPSFGDMIKQSLMAHTAKAFTAPIGEAIGGAVTSVIQTPFERNAEEFEELESIVRMKNNVKRSQESKDVFEKIESEINSSGLTKEEFFKRNTEERIAEDMNRNYAEFKSVPLAQAVLERSGELADQAVEYKDPATGETISLSRWKLRQRLYENAHKELQEVPGGTAEFDTRISRRNKRASNAAEAAIKGISRLFGGKSKEDLDAESIKALKNSALYRENEEFQSAYKLYLGSGNVENLKDMAQEILESGDFSTTKILTESKVVINQETGESQYAQRRVKVVTDIYGNTEQSFMPNENGEDFTIIPVPGTGHFWGKDLKTLETAAQKYLNPEGIGVLQEWVKENEHNMYRPKSLEEHTAVMDKIYELAEENKYKTKVGPAALEIFRTKAREITIRLSAVRTRLFNLEEGLRSKEGNDKVLWQEKIDRAKRQEADILGEYALAADDMRNDSTGVAVIGGDFDSKTGEKGGEKGGAEAGKKLMTPEEYEQFLREAEIAQMTPEEYEQYLRDAGKPRNFQKEFEHEVD